MAHHSHTIRFEVKPKENSQMMWRPNAVQFTHLRANNIGSFFAVAAIMRSGAFKQARSFLCFQVVGSSSSRRRRIRNRSNKYNRNCCCWRHLDNCRSQPEKSQPLNRSSLQSSSHVFLFFIVQLSNIIASQLFNIVASQLSNYSLPGFETL